MDVFNHYDNPDESSSPLATGETLGTEIPPQGTPSGNDGGSRHPKHTATATPSVTLRRISNFLSAIFSPILVPTYAYAITLWITPLSMFPERIRLMSTLIVFCITALVPFALILFLMRKGRISDPAVSNPSERLVPYIATIICYILAALYLWRMPAWVPRFFIGAGVAALLGAVITFKWKISAHATAMGGLCALLLFIGVFRLATVLIIPWIANTILLSGAVCSARLFLLRHTPAQVYAGWLMGFFVTFIIILF